MPRAVLAITLVGASIGSGRAQTPVLDAMRYAMLATPFIPFVADEVFTILGHDESVHLQDWPVPMEEWHAPVLAHEMSTLRSIVSMARNLREVNGISQRIPLRSVAVGGVPLELLTENSEFLMEELNVKSIVPLPGISDWTEESVSLVFENFARRLPHAVKAIVAAVRAGEFTIDHTNNLHAAGHVLYPNEYIRRLAVRPGVNHVALDDGILVSVDLVLDEALVLEGAARELNRRLQNLRKTAGLRYSDRVELSISGGSTVQQILARHRDWLMAQVLATALTTDVLQLSDATDVFELDGESVQIALRRSDTGLVEV